MMHGQTNNKSVEECLSFWFVFRRIQISFDRRAGYCIQIIRIFNSLSKRLLKLKIHIVGKLSLDAYDVEELNRRQSSKLAIMATENQ